MIRRLTIALGPVLLLVLMLWAAGLSAQDRSTEGWTRFRGPNGTGASDAKMPSAWSEKDYAWRVKLPGIGHSSAVHWGDRLFITSADPDDATQHILCINSNNGTTIWKQSFFLPAHHLLRRADVLENLFASDGD